MRITTCSRCSGVLENGLGPADLPILTEWLNKLPSSHVFYEAACRHDVLYHTLGGPESNREYADTIFLDLMKRAVREKVKFHLRWLYYASAYRNFLFVRKFGSIFFNYSGCRG
jgi:hypothetical protein